MRPGKSHEIVTALWATCALINGGIALGNNNEAVRADSAANVYEAQGDYAQADQYEATADDERGERNIYLGLTALNLALVGMNGSLAIAARNRRREAEQV